MIMSTEYINPRCTEIDSLGVAEIFSIINAEDATVATAVREAGVDICRAIEAAEETLRAGGRLFYIGAGTSGRLGVLDASEMPPTFSVGRDLIQAIIAGGPAAITTSAEGAEDDEQAGISAIADLTQRDMLIGITASGKAPFVLAALKEGRRKALKTWLLTCNDVSCDFVDGTIAVLTGPEVVSGSTRLKAGTATKMVLNMISTITMVRLGRVYRGYMIDVVPSNDKLRRRALQTVQEITGCSGDRAGELLELAAGSAKTAILMQLRGLNYQQAVGMLQRAGGGLRQALELSAIGGETGQ
ncbi:N-acetylmuramic acid 6-phosphate etherase [Candidatus Magnetobacterium bavaricum]|uniref:N-acetylmuramic acid 6-phosphate etherase n=1 Tax=Candidatus Magnetobacterium bavaricum TaxID=29290 RepID=A0A0F3GR76_9BACT|nr:N-acetylmuramic acid 6-phosphate etherase [Candidatus Magnetobacterium bavaricum]